MKVDSLEAVLGELRGAKKDGGTYIVAGDQSVTFYASLGRELVQIGRVTRVEIRKELIVVETAKKEHYYLLPDTIEALRTEPTPEPSKGAGFR